MIALMVYHYLQKMKTTKRFAGKKEGLSKTELNHIDLVQEARKANIYKPPTPKKELLQKATNLALKKSKDQNNQF
jgi:hypothetical protein